MFPLIADIAQRYRISKYPTLKLFRNGMMMKREYRGQRSVTAIADFIRQQKVDPIKAVESLEEISTTDVSVSRSQYCFISVAHLKCLPKVLFGTVTKSDRCHLNVLSPLSEE